MLTIAVSEIGLWLDQLLWPLLRIGALWMVLPVFGSGVVPTRVRLILALATTLMVLPLLPPHAPPPTFAAAWWLGCAQQIAIGVCMGFLLLFIFEAVLLGGQLVAMAMGLGFAEMSDPLRGVSSPVISQYFSIVATLLFLALGGHLLAFDWLVRSFSSHPFGAALPASEAVWTLLLWGGQIFAGAVKIALPATMALLLVNLSFGVISRSAPSLNLLAIGFPAALLFGLVMLFFSIPLLAQVFAGLLSQTWAFLAHWIGS